MKEFRFGDYGLRNLPTDTQLLTVGSMNAIPRTKITLSYYSVGMKNTEVRLIA